jgi:hypothetical protein
MSTIKIEKEDYGHADAVRRAFDRARSSDAVLLERALDILHRMATENTGRFRYFKRWYYADEPLRNDAANIIREAGFWMPQPIGTKLVGDGVDEIKRRDREVEGYVDERRKSIRRGARRATKRFRL